jgi:hypothetical protein
MEMVGGGGGKRNVSVYRGTSIAKGEVTWKVLDSVPTPTLCDLRMDEYRKL